MMKFKKFAIAAALATGILGFGSSAQAVPVALELALLVDVSGSVSAAEYNLQKSGYVNAFLDANVQANIASHAGGIAVTYIEWSGGSQQAQLVNWFHITDAASATAFAATLNGVSRAFSGSTAPGSAIQFVTPQFSTNAFEGNRWVIDVSGDGAENNGVDTSNARDAALAAGVDAINGLPILGEAGLLNFYTNNIKGGAGSFVLPAASFNDFEGAVAAKIGREIAQIPEPATLALFGLGLFGFVASRRRKQ